MWAEKNRRQTSQMSRHHGQQFSATQAGVSDGPG